MCGRYRLKDPEKAFAWIEVVKQSDFLPRFNIAPTQRVPVVTGPGKLAAMTWGIVPTWGKEPSKALINARSETIRERRTFKAAFSRRRCLMPADGFYEWRKVDKRPYFISVGGGAPFAIGAIWEEAADTPRCCLLTTTANGVVSAIHDRMPVIVRREDWAEWFEAGDLSEEGFGRITAPYADDEMAAIAVSPLVNNARIDDPRCSEPDAAAGEAPRKLVIQRKSPPLPDAQQTFGF